MKGMNDPQYVIKFTYCKAALLTWSDISAKEFVPYIFLERSFASWNFI